MHGHIGSSKSHVGLGHLEPCFKRCGVDSGNDRTSLNTGIKVNQHFRDLARDLRADLDGHDRLYPAGRGDHHLNLATIDLPETIARRFLLTVQLEKAVGSEGYENQNDEQPYPAPHSDLLLVNPVFVRVL